VIGQRYLTAFYYHGMQLASRIAELTGDKAARGKVGAGKIDGAV
jgi:hypothetical protein